MADSPTPPPALCLEPMEFPPPLCTRPRGHPGDHETEQIPAPLTRVAARMVSESDRLEREVAGHRETAHRQRLRNRVLSGVLIVLCVVNIAVLAALVLR